jgi:hypothetical protein
LNENDRRDEEIPLTYGTNEISVWIHGNDSSALVLCKFHW